MKPYKLFVLLAISLFFYQCDTSYFDGELNGVKFDGKVAIPLGEINVTLDEVLKELSGGSFDINEDDLITMETFDTLVSINSNDLAGFPNQSINKDFIISTAIVNPFSSEITVTGSSFFNFKVHNVNNIYLDSIRFSNGRLNLKLSSNINSTIVFTISAPFLKNKTNGTIPIIASQGVLSPNSSTSFVVDLSNYNGYFHLDENGNKVTNTIYFKLDYSIIIDSHSSVPAGRKLSLALDANNISYDNAFGTIVNKEVVINSQKVELSLTEILRRGDIYFAEPKIDLIFNNSIGTNATVLLDRVKVFNKENQSLPLKGSIVQETQTISGINISQLNTANASANSVISINSTNSNVSNLLLFKPTELFFDIRANLTTLSGEFFIKNDSKLDAFMRVTLPAYATLYNTEVRDTIKLNDNVTNQIRNTKSLLLNIDINNRLPLGGSFVLTFLSETNESLYTTDSQTFLNAAAISSDGITTSGSVLSQTDIVFNTENIEQIKNASKLEYVVILNSTNAQSTTGNPVRFFRDQDLTIKLNVEAETAIDEDF